jgi:hypothetical protein
MGSQNKRQPYPYSLKTIAASNYTSVCLNRFFMYMVPPKDALTIERLFCHFVFRFDSGISAADQKIVSVGIVDELVPSPITATSNYQRRQELNVSADANRRVDLSIDLTHLLKHDNVEYQESVLDDSPDTGYTAVEILLPSSLQSTLTVGVVELWKLDGLFTTTGIR